RLSALRGPCPAAAAGRALGRRVRPVGRGPGRVPPVRAGGRAMNLRAIGCNVESADVAIREKLAFDDARLRSALAGLSAGYGAEAVVLGTCNRVEIYLARPEDVSPIHAPLIAEFLAEVHGVAAEQVLPHLYEHADADAVRHAFRVAASLDSVVI